MVVDNNQNIYKRKGPELIKNNREISERPIERQDCKKMKKAKGGKEMLHHL